MTLFRGWADYLYPGTDVLRNKPGIRNPTRLRNAEEQTARVRMAEILYANPIEGDLDRPHMQAIHRHIFGDIYEWAGDLRVGPLFPEVMTKAGPSPESIAAGRYDTHDGHPYRYFPAGEEMPRHFDRYVNLLHSHRDLTATSREEFAAALAEPWGEINSAHVFREGNTRTQVVFFTYVARHYGHTLDYGRFRDDPAFRAKFNAARFLVLHNVDTRLLAETLSELIDVPPTPSAPTTQPGGPGSPSVDDYQPHYVSTTSEPEPEKRRTIRDRRKTAKKTNARGSSTRASTPASTAASTTPYYRAGLCGAMTTKGTPCRRRGRCPSHR